MQLTTQHLIKELEAQIERAEARIKELEAKSEAKQEAPPVWEPNIEESYYVADVGTVSEYEWCDDSVDEYYSKVGNLFKTEQEAKNYTRALKLIETIRRERFKAQGKWYPSVSEGIYTMFWRRDINGFGIHCTSMACRPDVFGSWRDRDVLRDVIKKYRPELEWYFTEYLPSIN